MKLKIANPSRIKILVVSILGVVSVLYSVTVSAQYRPELFSREDWKEIPPEMPVSQKHVNNADLSLNLYGAAVTEMRKSNHDHPSDDPFYVWSGMCEGNWALTLKNSHSYVDLSEYARIRWRAKQSGFRFLRVILKLGDGTWLVSDQCDDSSVDWRIREFIIDDITWYVLDMETIAEKQPVKDPDLSKVDEIGFTDLMKGGRSDACSRVDWIEVYGKPVDR